VAQGLAEILRPRFELLGKARDGQELIKLANDLRPDVLIADISMPVLSGLDAIRSLRQTIPKTKFIILTMHDDVHLAREAFRAGALGFVVKHSVGEELIQAIDEVMLGRMFITMSIAKNMVEDLAVGTAPGRPENLKLTARQQEVLTLIGNGNTMKEVAVLLGISRRTAESHKYQIMSLVGAQSTAHLIQYALKRRLI